MRYATLCNIIFFTIPIFCFWIQIEEGAYLYREREIRGERQKFGKAPALES